MRNKTRGYVIYKFPEALVASLNGCNKMQKHRRLGDKLFPDKPLDVAAVGRASTVSKVSTANVSNRSTRKLKSRDNSPD
jgi:hypothetical protein